MDVLKLADPDDGDFHLRLDWDCGNDQVGGNWTPGMNYGLVLSERHNAR